MKNFIHCLLFATTFFSFNLLAQEDFSLGEEFSDGDLITAESFNQIFDTIEKVNRTVVDADLVGTWSCDAITTRNPNISGWEDKGTFYQLSNAQVTFTSSGSSPSIDSPYTISTSAPSPFKKMTGVFSSVQYQLFNNMIFTKLPADPESRIYKVNVISEGRIDLVFQETSAATFPATYSSYIYCKSTATVPIPPSAVTATNAQTQVNIAWTDNSSDETGFKVYRKLGSATSYTQLATGIVINSYADTTITEGQTASYYVTAYNSNGESGKPVASAATLDSIKPSVSSHTPSSGAQVVSSAKDITIVFNEPVYYRCPSALSAAGCPDGLGIEVTGSDGTNYDISNSLVYFPNPSSIREISPNSNFATGSTISVRVKKDFWIDTNGNVVDTDYTFTFIVN